MNEKDNVSEIEKDSKKEQEKSEESNAGEESLIKNIKNFINSANKIYNDQDYTSAVILYFKALFSVLDLIILKDKGFAPKDHNERFRVLQKYFPKFYLIIDKNFHVYQGSYSKSVEKEVCDRIKQDVERIIKEQNI